MAVPPLRRGLIPLEALYGQLGLSGTCCRVMGCGSPRRPFSPYALALPPCHDLVAVEELTLNPNGVASDFATLGTLSGFTIMMISMWL